MTKLTQPFNDRAIRLFGVPLLGIIIPNVTGLITNYRYTFIQLVGCYAYFTIVSLVIWVGNVKLMYAIREKYSWRYSSYYKIVTFIFSANIFYSGIVSVVMLYVWSLVSNEMTHNWQPVYFAVVIIIISVLFITSLYENMFLNQERILNLSTVEQLNTAKVQAELEALKNQIDPHFIFNSLNTLSFLITKDPKSAKLYNDTLAKVYRYILSNKERDLVFLKEEIEFISNYFYLIKIRFDNAVQMTIEINDLESENFLIPPISLQALVENAIKHNEFTEKMPLDIMIIVSSGFVLVQNAMNPKTFRTEASGIGLSNLDNRYKLITRKNIIIENDFKSFSVKLPILKL